MKIYLSEIPEEGRSYHWTDKTGELTSVLKDLTGKNPYEAQFDIRPLNTKDYQLVGLIKTATPETCSRCGKDINYDVKARFHEILIPKQDQPRNGKYSRVNHVSDLPQGGPETSEYEGNEFDIGEFLHEAVAISIPFNPACPEMVDGKPSECKIPLDGQAFSYYEKMPEEKPQSPFAALKNLKLN